MNLTERFKCYFLRYKCDFCQKGKQQVFFNNKEQVSSSKRGDYSSSQQNCSRLSGYQLKYGSLRTLFIQMEHDSLNLNHVFSQPELYFVQLKSSSLSLNHVSNRGQSL